MPNVDSKNKNIVYFVIAGITIGGFFANSLKNYYSLQSDLENLQKSFDKFEQQYRDDCIEDKVLLKEFDAKIDGIDNAITHNNRDMVHFTNEIGEIKGIMREIQKKQ